MRVTLLATFFAFAFSTFAGAEDADFTKGKVKNIKPEQGKVTIIHEEITSLDMPAMTMVFVVQEEAMFEKLEPGADIEFVVERLEGKLVVTEIK